MPSAIALAILCWPCADARKAPSVRLVANPALELEQVGDDAVGDRARNFVLALRRREEGAIGAIGGESGFDQNGRTTSRREYEEGTLLHAAIFARMNLGHLPLHELGEPRRLAEILVQLEVVQNVPERAVSHRRRLEAQRVIFHLHDLQ